MDKVLKEGAASPFKVLQFGVKQIIHCVVNVWVSLSKRSGVSVVHPGWRPVDCHIQKAVLTPVQSPAARRPVVGEPRERFFWI